MYLVIATDVIYMWSVHTLLRSLGVRLIHKSELTAGTALSTNLFCT
jgi:hypothetical protein